MAMVWGFVKCFQWERERIFASGPKQLLASQWNPWVVYKCKASLSDGQLFQGAKTKIKHGLHSEHSKKNLSCNGLVSHPGGSGNIPSHL